MKCCQGTIIRLLVPVLVLGWSWAVPAKKPVRNGKFMAFTAEDMFADLLDDVHDPLTVAGTISEREKFYSMNDSVKATAAIRPKINDTKMTKLPLKTEEKIALYNQDTGKFELITTTSGHFSFPIKPVTENGAFFYGGQHYQYRRPMQQPQQGNRTEEIKIFWSAVGDAIENSPYFPIQINVPDMITAMTNFLVNYIPFINRLTNPNHPRLPYQVVNRNQTEHRPVDYYENYDMYQTGENSLSRRELKNGENPEAKSAKDKRKTKRKSNKKKNSAKTTAKGIFPRPNFRKTTSAPVEDIKLWHQFGSDQKETLRLKNMPITRKRVRVADREIFNFKNSDISNSPIMILNVPHRPITHYKVTQQELREKEPNADNNQRQFLQPQQQQQQQQQQLTTPHQAKSQTQIAAKSAKQTKQTKQSKQTKRKTKTELKPKRSSKRSGRSEAGDVNEQQTGNESQRS